MNIEVLQTAEAVAQRAAEIIAGAARTALTAQGRFVMAVSGNHGQCRMLQALAISNMPWCPIHVAQVDERVAPAGDANRNLIHLHALLDLTPLPAGQIHAIPVEADDLSTAALQYAATLQRVAGSPPLLDLVHLGLGPDGHTASLIPGDPVLSVGNADVAVTRPYHGRRRITLTYPVINRSRQILWVVTGNKNAQILKRFLAGDESIPAARVRRERALVIADVAAVLGVKPNAKRRN